MCKTPSFVWVKRGPEYVQVPVPCDNCWYCRENYVSDWVGRCLCEAAVSEVSVTLSLTYATPDNHLDLSHRVVNPWHFQLFMKRLRKAGHKVRYLVAGEYGDLRDRAHFHCILFFKKLVHRDHPAPKLENRAAFKADPSIAQPLSRQMPQKDMCHVREWPHGHVEADWSASEKSVRYCCEYLNPQAGKKTGWFSMSKKPSLGFEWFAAKAERNREFGVLPSSFEYLPPGGKPGKVYLMTGATRRDYLNMITQDREVRPRMSKWVRATFDKLERQAFIDSSVAAFDDEAFRDRQMPLEKQRSLLVLQEGLQKVSNERFTKLLALAWGFDDVEEFEAFVAHGGTENHPEYFRGWPEHVQGCQGDSGGSVDAGPLREAPSDLRRGSTVKESPSGVQKAATISQPPSRDREPEPRPESLTLNDAQGEKRQEERCKRTPPPSNKGNGGSRRFVPWDRKC